MDITSEPFVRREIVLVAYQNKAFDWIKEYKESFKNMESWQQAAFIFSVSGLPEDEKTFFYNIN